MYKLLFTSLFLFLFYNALTQKPVNRSAGGQNRPAITGKFYGKVIDQTTGKGVEFATVKLTQMKFDSTTQSKREMLVTGVITKPNGEFTLENVSVFGQYTLTVSSPGYQNHTQTAAFPKPEQGMQLTIEKDLGNIKLKADTVMLEAVTIDGREPSFKMAIDKKIFNVADNINSVGGTAEDVLKNVPSVDVDMDGNVTLRNAAPQIFVDGKLSTLTIDQIPADAIQSIEIITNPSAKYDASGGMGGIINIVLKKDRKIGFNGSVRAGIDMRTRFNGGADLNVREGKVNFFISSNINQRKSIGITNTDRINFFGNPATSVIQQSNSTQIRNFYSNRGGIDWFITNRSTLTLSGNYNFGKMSPIEDLFIQTDSSLIDDQAKSYSRRYSETVRKFQNAGSSVQFKHLFPVEGRELNIDLNYNMRQYNSLGEFNTQLYNYLNLPVSSNILQEQRNSGKNQFYTFQLDYTTPVKQKMKIETGTRITVRNFNNDNRNYNYDTLLMAFYELPGFTNQYRFIDNVYAGYVTLTQKIKKFGYQLGLRAESSDYRGKLTQTAQTFQNIYPISLFPSAYINYTIKEGDDIQFNYSRRVNRPSFFNLIPFIDYSDSLNLSRGNGALKPEFTNSLELSYLKTFNKNHNLLSTLYFKNTNNLITRYQVFEYNEVLNRDVVINTYINATRSYAYGLELTSKHKIKQWLDFTTNLNFYNSVINGSNVESSLQNELFSWFGKLNFNIKLPKNLSFQLTANYHSRTALQMGGGGYGWGMGGGSFSTAQGYNREYYEINLALRYSFLKNNAASLTFTVDDVFKTRVNGNFAQSAFFVQEVIRTRDQRFFKLNFTYRFGKFDSSLFRRKNNRNNIDSDMGM